MCQPRPNSEFTFESARSKLISLNLNPSDLNGPKVNFVVPGDVAADDGTLSGDGGALLRLSGWIDMENRVSVGCAGAIISYIQRRRTAAYLPGDPAAQSMHKISAVEMFGLSGSM